MEALCRKKKNINQPPVKLMVAIAIISFFMSAEAPGVFALEETKWDKYTNEEIVNAIYKAEGGNKATYLYGIRSIDTKGNKEYARQICLNSVRNGRARWEKAGKPYDLIIYIGLRYCPPTAHKLNSNWVRNVKYFLTKEIK